MWSWTWKHFLILAYTITGSLYISAFASLIGITIGITNSATGAIAAGIQKSKSITTKKEKKHDKIILLANSKLNSIEVLMYKALID